MTTLLYLVTSPDDVPVLASRVRPGPQTQVRVVNVTERFPEGHEFEGMPKAVIELAEFRADAVIFSPHIGQGDEIEAIMRTVLGT